MRNARLAFMFVFLGAAAVVLADPPYPDKVTSTPNLIQYGFGPSGQDLPGDGTDYCGPVAWANGMFWLYSNGYTQLAPTPFEPAPSLPYIPTDSDPNAVNMVRVLAGLFGTAAYGGTYGTPTVAGLQTYLSMKGIGSSHYEVVTTGLDWTGTAPTMDWYNENTSGYGIGVVNIYGYNITGTNYAYNFGHNITFLQSTSSNSMVVANPWPWEGPTNPQTLNLQEINDGSDFDGYLSIPNYYNDPTGQPTIVLQDALALQFHTAPGDLPSEPDTWTISEDVYLNTNNGSVDILAPLSGTATLKKFNTGTATLTNHGNFYHGEIVVSLGTLESTIREGRPLGDGKISLVSGTLAISPKASGTMSDISFIAASGTGNSFGYQGGGVLALNSGTYNSLTLRVGSEDGVTPAFTREGHGTLAIAASGGNAALGNTVKLLAASAAQAPVTGALTGLVDTSIVAQDTDTSGDFLTYDPTDGFKVADYTSSSGPIMNGTTNTTVYHAVNSQTVTGTAAVYAIKVDAGVTVGGGAGSTLQVGNTAESQQAGVILNGGSISTATVDSGTAELTVFTSTANGTITGGVQAGGVTTFGPGTLTVSTGTVTGGTTTVTAGTFFISNSGSTSSWQSDVYVNPGGQLAGVGTIAGNVDVYGTITAGPNPSSGAGILNVDGNLTIAGAVMSNDTYVFTSLGGTIEFTLNAYTDSNGGGTMGLDWSGYDITGALTLDDYFSFNVNFVDIDDPLSGDSFWTESHRWLVATADSISLSDNVFDSNAFFPLGSFYLGHEDGNLYLHYDDYPNPYLVPEPGVAALLSCGVLLFLCRRRKTLR